MSLSGVEILCKGTVSAYFRANRRKPWENCVFPQNSHTMKLCEIIAFHAVVATEKC